MRRMVCALSAAIMMTFGVPVSATAADNELRDAIRRAAEQAASAQTVRRELSPALKWTAIGLFAASAVNLGMAIAADEDNPPGCRDFGCRKAHLNMAGAFAVAGGAVLVVAYVKSSRSPSVVITPQKFTIRHTIRF